MNREAIVGIRFGAAVVGIRVSMFHIMCSLIRTCIKNH